MRHDTPSGVAVPAETPSSELHELLTVEEVAALLRVNKSWVYEHTRGREVATADRLPHIKIGKYLRFDAQAVRAFVLRKALTR
jgi:excisionase family DNA binding protein